MKNVKIVLAALGICLLMAWPLAQAQENNGYRPHPRIEEIYSQLGLSTDQKKELEVNKEQHRARTEKERLAMKQTKEALQEELMKPQLNMPVVNKLHNRIKLLLSRAEDDKLTSILAVRTILTPDQFARFVNLMHKYRQEHGK